MRSSLEIELETHKYLKGAFKISDKPYLKVSEHTRQSMITLFGSVFLTSDEEDSYIINKIKSWYNPYWSSNSNFQTINMMGVFHSQDFYISLRETNLGLILSDGLKYERNRYK